MWILMVYKPTYNWGSENPLVLSAADIRSCPTSLRSTTRRRSSRVMWGPLLKGTCYPLVNCHIAIENGH